MMGKQYGRTGNSLGNPLKMLKKIRVGGQKIWPGRVTWNTQFFILFYALNNVHFLDLATILLCRSFIGNILSQIILIILILGYGSGDVI